MEMTCLFGLRMTLFLIYNNCDLFSFLIVLLMQSLVVNPVIHINTAAIVLMIVPKQIPLFVLIDCCLS